MTKRQRLWFADIRSQHGLNLTETAERCGLSISYLCEIERGDKDPSVRTAQKIGQALGFEWTRFFEESQGETESA